MRKTRFEIEHENLSKALDRRSSSLAKLSSPGFLEDSVRKYAEGLTAHVLSEYKSQLRKGASVVDMGAIMKHAAEEYCASSPSPLAEIENEIGALGESMDRMRKALPAYRRWALHGISDPGED
jgi:hypothetical protein